MMNRKLLCQPDDYPSESFGISSLPRPTIWIIQLASSNVPLKNGPEGGCRDLRKSQAEGMHAQFALIFLLCRFGVSKNESKQHGRQIDSVLIHG